MTTTDLIALIAALGIGTIIPKVIEGLIGWLTGRQDAERRRIRDLAQEYERADAKRRMLAEHASQLRRMLLDLGHTQEDLPPWPIIPERKEDQ